MFIGLRLCIVNVDLLVITSDHYEPVIGGAPIWKSLSPRNTKDQFLLLLVCQVYGGCELMGN